MRGSDTRASQYRLKIYKLTNQGMKPNELLDHLKQRIGNEEEMTKEEINKLRKNIHREEKAIREERDETKKRRSVMTTDVPTHGN